MGSTRGTGPDRVRRSAAVYAERGRHGGFALLPGFRTELTGLNHDEALALLTAGSGRGEDRTYRLTRMLAAEELPEPANRSTQVDLEQLWRQRCAQFLSDGHIAVLARVNPARRDDLLKAAVAVRTEEVDADGWLRLEVTYQDLWHAEWALWQFSTDAEALAPQALRTSLRNRATAIVSRYAESCC